MRITSITVQGDHDLAYAITVTSDGQARCTCPAFRYGHGDPCKHMRFAANALGAVSA